MEHKDKYQRVYQKFLDVAILIEGYTEEELSDTLDALRTMADLEERGVLIIIGTM